MAEVLEEDKGEGGAFRIMIIEIEKLKKMTSKEISNLIEEKEEEIQTKTKEGKELTFFNGKNCKFYLSLKGKEKEIFEYIKTRSMPIEITDLEKDLDISFMENEAMIKKIAKVAGGGKVIEDWQVDINYFAEDFLKAIFAEDFLEAIFDLVSIYNKKAIKGKDKRFVLDYLEKTGLATVEKSLVIDFPEENSAYNLFK